MTPDRRTVWEWEIWAGPQAGEGGLIQSNRNIKRSATERNNATITSRSYRTEPTFGATVEATTFVVFTEKLYETRLVVHKFAPNHPPTSRSGILFINIAVVAIIPWCCCISECTFCGSRRPRPFQHLHERSVTVGTNTAGSTVFFPTIPRSLAVAIPAEKTIAWASESFPCSGPAR